MTILRFPFPRLNNSWEWVRSRDGGDSREKNDGCILVFVEGDMVNGRAGYVNPGVFWLKASDS